MSNKKHGWVRGTIKKWCPSDCWYEGVFAIEGTWNEKEGTWLEWTHYCSNCGRQQDLPHFKYCPDCGAKMEFVEGEVET